MGERVLVLGAGIGGLSTALALGGSGREITIIDRDPPPPDTSADEAFSSWEHKGVGHLRHSHAFLSRLSVLIRDNYPELLKDLREAGCRELHFADNLAPTLKANYVAVPGDDDLTILTSRRTTLEFVMRRYVARQPGIHFVTDTRVRGLITKRLGDAVAVGGVIAEDDSGTREIHADIVVDAGGKNGLAIDWLQEAGVTIKMEEAPSGILYFTRHYRLRDGKAEPERTSTPTAGDLGYIKYGLFPADNRCFSITLAVPEIEMEMRRAVMHEDVFDAVCANIPGIARWTTPDLSEPRSRVFGMGELLARWRHMLKDGKPLALNYFPLGDTVIRTNPLYGRGCSFAAVQAHILRDVLDETRDPMTRATSFHTKVWDELRPYYDDMLKQDANAIRRSANALNPDYKPSFKARLAKSFAEDAIIPAIRSDINLMRAFMRGFNMVDAPSVWLKDVRNLWRVFRVWIRGKKRNAALYPPKLGPGRAELMSTLGLSVTADIERIKKAA